MSFEETFRNSLLNWFQNNARILPWRQQPSLYKTIVSEFMLQQTQVKTVLPFFNRWIKQFPTFEALAQASEEQVVQVWAGLGYYSRAKNLHALAKAFVQTPATTYEMLLKHKGIGTYTAAAIASIIFNESVAVVDGNVIRVLARIFEQTQQFKSKDAAIKWCNIHAQQLLDPQFPGKFNEAIMELGALICTKNNPKCSLCPVNNLCLAYKNNTVEQCPQFTQILRKKCCKQRLWICSHQQILLEPSHVGKQSLLEIPELTQNRSKVLSNITKIFIGKRSISTTDYTEEIYKPVKSLHLTTLLTLPDFSSCKLCAIKDLTQYPICGPHRKWIQQIVKFFDNLNTNFS